MEGRKEKSTIYAYQSNGDGLLVSYVDKKKAGNKSVLQRINVSSEMSILSMIIPKEG